MAGASRENVRSIGYYTPRDVARLAGVTPHRVGRWAREGIILPSVSQRPNIYSYADAGEAILAHYLVTQGKTPAEVKEIVHKLRDEFGDWPLATAPLAHDGRLLLVKRDDVYISVDRDDHEVLGGTLVNLKVIRDALGRGGWVAIEKPRKHIEIDPDRHSGEPVVRGHRISTARVASIAAEPDGRKVLAEDFGLEPAEIDDALAYEADLAAFAA